MTDGKPGAAEVSAAVPNLRPVNLGCVPVVCPGCRNTAVGETPTTDGSLFVIVMKAPLGDGVSRLTGSGTVCPIGTVIVLGTIMPVVVAAVMVTVAGALVVVPL